MQSMVQKSHPLRTTPVMVSPLNAVSGAKANNPHLEFAWRGTYSRALRDLTGAVRQSNACVDPSHTGHDWLSFRRLGSHLAGRVDPGPPVVHRDGSEHAARICPHAHQPNPTIAPEVNAGTIR